MADPSPSKVEVTRLLGEFAAGRQAALDELVPVVYEELQAIARRQLRNERVGHTLDTRALVHEAYLQLVDVTGVEWKGRAHFYGIAGRAMRRILIQHARHRNAQKRGGGAVPVPLDEAILVTDDQAERLLALEEALDMLEAENPRYRTVVEQRFYGGMTLEEIAHLLDVSVATVKRDWTVARAWLNRALSEDLML